jgi:hypothetical protein
MFHSSSKKMTHKALSHQNIIVVAVVTKLWHAVYLEKKKAVQPSKLFSWVLVLGARWGER